MKVSEGPIVLEYKFSKPIQKLWESLVNIDQMLKWFFDNIPDFKAEVGFKTSFSVQNENRVFTHLWEVIKVVPANEITYKWEYEEYSGKSVISFLLSPEAEAVILKITINVNEDFPSDIPEFERESCIQGWNYFIDNRLREYLTTKD